MRFTASMRRVSTSCATSTSRPHKEYLVGQKHILVVGGALFTEGTDEPLGSLYIVNVANRAAAEAFSGTDPFTRAGVFATVTITAMRKSHWNPASA